jgi:hypothetical protein
MQNFLSGILHDANDANDLNYKHGLLQCITTKLGFLINSLFLEQF